MMALSVSKDPESRYAFLKRRRIPKVPKCKLNEVSSDKGWNVCSLGFDESIISSPRKRSRFANKFSSNKDKNLTNEIRENPKYEGHSRENYLSKRRCKYLKQKSVLLNIENIQSEFTVHRKSISPCDDKTVQIENDSSQTHNNHALDSHHRTKQNASVLLKMKDIQESFLNDKSLIRFKPFSSENLNLSSVSNLVQKNDCKLLFSHPDKFSEFSTVFSTDFLNFNFGTNEKFVDSSALPLKNQGSDVNVNIPLKSANNLPVVSELKTVIKEICDNLNVENLDKHKISDYSKEQFHILNAEKDQKYKEADCINKQLYNGSESKITAISGNKTSGKGSNWVHSLKWTEECEKNESTDWDDQAGKKNLKNLLQGGFAEQLLKLQRLELSDKVIWNHKFHKRKKDFCSNLNLMITAVSYFGDLVVTKCILLNSHASSYNNSRNKTDSNCKDSETEGSNTIISAHVNNVDTSFNENEPPLNSKIFFVLFRRNLFCKQQLKVRETFQLFEPWHIISLTSVPFPVILNTYFIEPEKLQPMKGFACPQHNEYEIPSILKTVQHCSVSAIQKSIPCFDEQMLFFSRWKHVTLAARVQRIWENKISSRKRKIFINLEDHSSFSLLLQTQDGIFCELCVKLDFLYLQTLWSEIIENGEGKCYVFHNLLVTHRYHYKKYLQLFQVINTLSQKQADYNKHFSVPLKRFCYQFMPSSTSSVSPLDEEISREKFPIYCNFDIQPLSMFQKVTQGDRFTCIGKILLEFKNEYYITDESLMDTSLKYVKFRFAPSFQIDDSIVGSIVLLKEVMFDEDCLEIDKYCKLVILPKSAESAGSVTLPSATLVRIKEFACVNLLHVLSPLHFCSNSSDLVIVEGIITHVDENEAMSWLECSFCFKDNLLQDANSVIYCEDCSCIVPKPILNVKMEVIICDQNAPSLVIKIQLVSSTIKSLLKISDDIFQPQCSITDVLGKKIGPLCCYIRASEKSGEKKTFHLTEIQSDVS